MNLAIKTYRKAIRQVQTELSPPERALSKLIHSRPIWHISQLCELVLLRFTPLFIGYSVALVCGLLFIGLAVVFNYSIHSLHILFLLFIVGYLVGIVVDYITVLSKQ